MNNKNNYKYLRDCDDTWGFASLQDKILEVMIFIHNLCVKYGIEYYLFCGSALGAYRHKGFIPWDDDLDICMTVKNYDKFKEAMHKENNPSYYLQEWGKCNGMCTMAKVRDNNTTLIEDGISDWNINHGVYVDIFLLHKGGPTLRNIKKQYFWAKYLVLKGQSTKKYKAKKWWQNLAICLVKLFPARFLLNHSLKQLYKYDYNEKFDCKYFCHFVGRGKLNEGLHEIDILGTPKLCAFEKVELYCPEQIEKLLAERWGPNFMTPPSVDKIKNMQHPSTVDLNTSYTEYPRTKIVMKKDERRLIL